jgi:hypothetical protein
MPIVEASAVFAHSKSKNLADKIEQEMLKAADKARGQGKSIAATKVDMEAARQKVKDDLDLPGNNGNGNGNGNGK